MANEEHVALLKQGTDVWNGWRRGNPNVVPILIESDLAGVNLIKADLNRADLNRADLRGANLIGANLTEADLNRADLRGANLTEADLNRADLRVAHLTEVTLAGATLAGANLNRAFLQMTNLNEADLAGANLDTTYLAGANLDRARLAGANLAGAYLHRTVLSDVDLTETRGLDQCHHIGPSIIDHQTLQKSGRLPLVFLRGVGLSDTLIEYLPSLLNQPVKFYSCFISYSSKDQAFAERLHADLQNKGVRCWFAPHNLPWGAKTWDTIDEAIRLRDKVLLILSKKAIASDWVEDEVTKAYSEERKRKQIVLFPVRLDNAVMKTDEAWASKLRDQRNIGDFTRWKDHDAYWKSFERLMRDLTIQQKPKVP